MPANVNPLPVDPPNTPPVESSTSGSKVILPRKLSRLLLDAQRPLYLLDNRGHIHFANSSLLEILKTTEANLVGLDCNRVLTGDDHRHPTLAGLLAIPERARTTQLSFDQLSVVTTLSTEPWTSRLVIPLDSLTGQDYVLCIWLRADDPLVIQASQHMEWLAQAEVRTALLDARRSVSRLDGLHSLIGTSPSAQLARRQAQVAIAGNMPVCIIGPVGSEKATLARAIYQQRRKREQRLMASGRLLPIDCRLMDRSLMKETLELAAESETMNRTNKDNEPTSLLLSGIDLLSSDAFVPLAHFLDHNPNSTVFATSRAENLPQLHLDQVWQKIVAHLQVMTIHLEPLSKRIEDIAPLAESILEEMRVASSGYVRRFLSSAALSWLQAYPWPNNHRELGQVIEDACKKTTSPSIEPNHFSIALRTFPSFVLKPDPEPQVHLDQMLEEFERNVLQKAIELFPRNRAAAARHLGISRTRLLRRLAQLSLETTTLEIETSTPSQGSEDAPLTHDSPIFEEIPDEPHASQ